MSGKSHSIITGFTILDTKTGKTVTKSTITKVFMKKITDGEIDNYIKTGEPFDKAGAYAIQEKGAAFVQKIEGDFNSAVGLPITELLKELDAFGIKIK